MCILTFVFCPTRSNLKESLVALMAFLILTPSTPVPWVYSGDCGVRGANSPSQAKHVVSESYAKELLMTTLIRSLLCSCSSGLLAVQLVAGLVQQFLCLAN